MRSHNKTSKVLAMILSLVMVAGIFAYGEITDVADDTSYASASSGFSISGETKPGTLKKGQSFTLKGTIKSNLKLKTVTVGVVNSSGDWVESATYTVKNVNSTVFNIYKSADSHVKFGKLSAGTYTYKVYVKDVKNKEKYLISQKFTVKSTTSSSSISLSSYSYPKALYKGNSFSVKGTIKSTYKLKSVKVGVVKVSGSKTSWISKATYTVKPYVKTYSIANMDSHIKFGKVPAGTYYYRVYATDTKGNTKRLLNKKFTVSSMSVSTGYKYPTTLKKGSSFSISGTVKSTFKLKTVTVGVTNTGGSWKIKYKASPNATSYSIANADSKIKFGTLSKGTYYYRVEATDNKGKTKRLINKKFTVTATGTTTSSTVSLASTSSGDTVLSYESSLIAKIGKQPCSGPCGIYCMAYAKAILNGTSFTKHGYSSICSYLKAIYGYGTNYAYWRNAGGSSVYYSTKSSCYKVALAQLKAGKPCILAIENGSTGNNHYICLVGYVKGTTSSNVALNKFIALDPASGNRIYLKNYSYYKSYDSPQLITF